MNKTVHKDVLLVVHDVYQEHNTFPLGVGYIAAMLEKNNFTVEIYCMDVFHYSNADLAKKLSKNDYEIIGVGFMSARFNETVVDLCKTINEHKKNAWLVLGGHGASPIPEYMLDKVKCDAVAVGEAEITILEMLEDKKNGRNKRIYKSKPIKNLDSIPFPAWHLFPMDIYTTNSHYNGMEKDDRIISMLTTRGCINNCSFCYRMEKGIRLRSNQNIINEMLQLKERYRVNCFHMADELFLVSKKRILEFERLLKENDLEIKYIANARVDIFDREIAESLKRTGCILLNVGFESSSQAVLNEMNKNTTIEENMQTLKISKELHLPVGLNFIWGFQNDTKETMMCNKELIKKYNQYCQLRTIRPVTPYPGCPLYYDAINKGLLDSPEDFFNRFKNSDLLTVNFTQYPDEQIYDWLYETNSDLIHDHYRHTNGNMDKAEDLISNFKDLYNRKTIEFRGAREYNK